MKKNYRLAIVFLVLLNLLPCTRRVRAQDEASVSAPTMVKAGERITFTITLDKAPNFDSWYINWECHGPDLNQFGGTQMFASGIKQMQVVLNIPATASAGTYHFHVIGLVSGKEFPLEGADAVFTVVRNENLVFPTKANVRISMSQAQLLRTAAGELQRRLQRFKAELNKEVNPQTALVEKTTRENLEEALKALTATGSEFNQLSYDNSQRTAAQIFFGDLRVSYVEALEKLQKLREQPTVNDATYGTLLVNSSASPGYPMIAQEALRSLEQNELAYSVVVDTESLTFDLTVTSHPTGADVCYHRRGDPCHPNSNQTNTTITALPYAIWLVQFHKDGYKTEEREHDPFREPNHVINVELNR